MLNGIVEKEQNSTLNGYEDKLKHKINMNNYN